LCRRRWSPKSNVTRARATAEQPSAHGRPRRYCARLRTLEIRASNPRLILKLPPVLKVDYSQFPTLDKDKADHRIIAEYAEILKNEPGSPCSSTIPF
jgi:hypothetical protein